MLCMQGMPGVTVPTVSSSNKILPTMLRFIGNEFPHETASGIQTLQVIWTWSGTHTCLLIVMVNMKEGRSGEGTCTSSQ